MGSYRVFVTLAIAGGEAFWIATEPIRIGKPELPAPTGEMSLDVEVRKDMPYAGDQAKHKLDVFLPIGKKDFPVMVFFHGGSWRSGDRAQYALLGNRFAKAG